MFGVASEDMVDRADLGGGLAVLGNMVGAALTWAAGIGVGTVPFSVGLGAFLTYFVTVRTQKSAWKQEGELRKVDEIYGPVYFELNKIHQALSQNIGASFDNPFMPSGVVEVPGVTWESIQSGYKYYLVDPSLRGELDDFISLLSEYRTGHSQRYSVVSEMLLPRLKNAFGEDVQAVSYQLAGETHNRVRWAGAGGTLDEPILAGEDPLSFSA